MLPDLYEVLGVTPRATLAEVKRAYHERVKACHPDRNPGDAAALARFQQVQEAYRVLGNARERLSYDQTFTEEQRLDHDRTEAAHRFRAWQDAMRAAPAEDFVPPPSPPPPPRPVRWSAVWASVLRWTVTLFIAAAVGLALAYVLDLF